MFLYRIAYFTGFHWFHNCRFKWVFSSRLWCHIRRSRLLPSARQQVCASHCLHRKIKQHHVDPLSFQHTSCARAELNSTTVCSLPQTHTPPLGINTPLPPAFSNAVTHTLHKERFTVLPWLDINNLFKLMVPLYIRCL